MRIKCQFVQTIRFSHYYDQDLIALYQDRTFGLAGKMREGISAYCKGERMVYDLPGQLPDQWKNQDLRFNLVFDAERDLEVREWLETLEEGSRSAAIKGIFRRYCLKGFFLLPMVLEEKVPHSPTGQTGSSKNGNRIVQRNPVTCERQNPEAAGKGKPPEHGPVSSLQKSDRTDAEAEHRMECPEDGLLGEVLDIAGIFF